MPCFLCATGSTNVAPPLSIALPTLVKSPPSHTATREVWHVYLHQASACANHGPKSVPRRHHCVLNRAFCLRRAIAKSIVWLMTVVSYVTSHVAAPQCLSGCPKQLELLIPTCKQLHISSILLNTQSETLSIFSLLLTLSLALHFDRTCISDTLSAFNMEKIKQILYVHKGSIFTFLSLTLSIQLARPQQR